MVTDGGDMQDQQALWSSREKLSPTTTVPEGVRVFVPIPDLQSRRLGGGGKALVPSWARSTVRHPRTRYNPRSKTCVLQVIQVLRLPPPFHTRSLLGFERGVLAGGAQCGLTELGFQDPQWAIIYR
uniref:Uncharacterized protein n=1 Tax=Timema shepardi TaxID=629360 RepID=A0A7R9B6X8_TIMSH|nr:unnamed protein product [Timema shepardi]